MGGGKCPCQCRRGDSRRQCQAHGIEHDLERKGPLRAVAMCAHEEADHGRVTDRGSDDFCRRREYPQVWRFNQDFSSRPALPRRPLQLEHQRLPHRPGLFQHSIHRSRTSENVYMLVRLLFCSLQMASALVMNSAARAFAPPRAASVQMIWHVFPRDGAASLLVTDHFVERGQQQALGCYDMGMQPSRIPPDQCIVQAADGSCIYVYARGTQPTGWRRPERPWTWMQPGEQVTLGNGHKVSLDCNDPESAVFKSRRRTRSKAGTASSSGTASKAGTASSRAGTASSRAGTASSRAGTASSRAGTASSRAGTASRVATASNRAA